MRFPEIPGPARFALRTLWIAALAGILVFMRASHGRPPAALPVLWQMPAWELTDQDSRTFGARELQGKIYIANFIFTSCSASCPRMTHRMATLQPRVRAFGGRVRLVSVTVDPVTDTPARLRAYAARYDADPTLWSFVTGPADAVLRAVSEGFKIGVEQPPPGANANANDGVDPVQIAHANRFALVDARGRLRGSYEADDEGTARLTADLATLVAER